jgi:alpha-beta hydrolase superfamily lysophospholipase
MPRRRWLRVLLAAVAAYFLASAVVGILVAEGTLHPVRPNADRISPGFAARLAGENRATWREIEVRATDGAPLYAWLFNPTADSNGRAVVLLHGVADNRTGMSSHAALFLRHGYSVLMPDSRAHGTSDGSVATYGLLERGDVRTWLDWLIAQEHPRCTFALGESMGAAILIQTLAEENRFCAAVAEGSFSSFREIGYHRLGQQLGLGWPFSQIMGMTLLRPALEFGFLWARLRYGFDLTTAEPASSIKKTQTPVLLIQGYFDENIPKPHGKVIFSNAPKDRVSLWMPDAGHTAAYSTKPQEFERRVIGFFQEHAR